MTRISEMMLKLVAEVHAKEAAEVERRLVKAIFKGKNLAVGRRHVLDTMARPATMTTVLVFAEMDPGVRGSPFPPGTTDGDRWTLHLCGGMKVGEA